MLTNMFNVGGDLTTYIPQTSLSRRSRGTQHPIFGRLEALLEGARGAAGRAARPHPMPNRRPPPVIQKKQSVKCPRTGTLAERFQALMLRPDQTPQGIPWFSWALSLPLPPPNTIRDLEKKVQYCTVQYCTLLLCISVNWCKLWPRLGTTYYYLLAPGCRGSLEKAAQTYYLVILDFWRTAFTTYF